MNRLASSSLAVTTLALAAVTLHCNPVLDVGHNESDAIVDADDTSTSACNVNDGLCRPGEGCSPDDCTRCVCDDTHAWLCTTTCPDAGPCPPSIPKNGTTCASADTTCSYENGCRKLDFAVCSFRGTWEIWNGVCDPPRGCPDRAPPPGTPCHDFVPRCDWRNACGVWYSGSCDGTKWTVSSPLCVPEACPPVTPFEKSPCSVLGLKCEWSTSCDTDDYALCTDKGWAVKTTCSPMQCPAITPADGAPCASEGTKCVWPAGCEAGTYREATCTSAAWSFAPGCR